ncbi:MAG: multiple sugar transport system substrate-binding protein [Actinomycetota bacterium]|nr:multiple sugar transport system substrate-binding protein [Actinomycetota bacterium]
MRPKVTAVMLFLVAVLGPAACAGGGAKAGDGPVEVELWSWSAGFQPVVDHFNATHPDIKIRWTNAGTGEDEYTKLQTALKAGRGAPDVVMLEYAELPTIQLTKHLVDLGKYGANDLKDEYVGWAWDQVSDGDSVYAVPVDAGPMALIYRKDLFQAHGLTVPTTWAQYAELARQVKKVAPNSYLTDFGSNDGLFVTALAWQGGARHFTYSPSKLPNIGITIDSPETKKVLTYWEELVRGGAVDTAPYWTTDFYNGLSSGKYFSLIAASWTPDTMASVAKATAGKWAVAPLPQWGDGKDVQASWGGSAFAVTDQSKHPEQAARVALELFGKDLKAWRTGIDTAYLFPTSKAVQKETYFIDHQWPFFGGQKVNEIFRKASDGIGDYEWSPFSDYVFSQLSEQINKAVADRSSWTAAVTTVQGKVTAHATEQGFVVNK